MTDQQLEKITQALAKLPADKIDQIETMVKVMGKRALNLNEASQLLNVSKDTLRRAIRSGRIKAFQLNKAGSYRIATDDLEEFMKKGIKE